MEGGGASKHMPVDHTGSSSDGPIYNSRPAYILELRKEKQRSETDHSQKDLSVLVVRGQPGADDGPLGAYKNFDSMQTACKKKKEKEGR